jgi:thiol-disulfide isomerase/thioredoxin
MRAISRLLGILIFAMVALPARAETWQTLDGQFIEGRLSGVFGSVAIISETYGTGVIPINRLDDAGLARVADYLDASPKAPPIWANSSGKIASGLRKRLQILQGGKIVAFDPGTRPEPEIYLVYFGAHWCPPCREFSPKLLERYRRLKERAPDRFELVFVSSDHTQDEQSGYVRELGMPWPIMNYTDVGSIPVIEQSDGPAIPDLVVLTRNGEVIFNSFHGAEYVGPEFVLDQTETLLNAMDDGSQSSRWALHRLAVVRYIRAAAGRTSNPRPYMVGLDRSHYQTLQTKKFNALLDIDDHGRVTNAKAEPELPVALEFSFEQDALAWLFLPYVSNGQPKPTKIILPIVF